MEEFFVQSADISETGTFQHNIDESFISDDYNGDTWKERITESLAIIDPFTSTIMNSNATAEEILDTLSIFFGSTVYKDLLIEVPTIADSNSITWKIVKELTENLLVADIVTAAETALI